MQAKTIELPKEKRKSIFDPNTPTFAARISLIVSFLIALITFSLGWVEGSLFYKTNGLVALTDVINSAILLTAVAHSERTPDNLFNYGYGKYESLGIFVSSTLITLITIYTVYEAIQSFGEFKPIGNFSYLILFSLFSSFVMFRIHKLLMKFYKRFQLSILRYDAELWKIDSFIELGVLVNLTLCFILNSLGYTFEARIFDLTGAILFVVFAMRIPIKFGKKSIEQLLDRTLPEEFHYNILSVIAENFRSICEFKNVYARQSGKDIFVEIDIVLPYDMTLEQAYEIEKNIVSKIKSLYPSSLPRIYVTPCKKDCIHENTNTCPAWRWSVQLKKSTENAKGTSIE
ncbi:MAG: cation diffusion facilitator family transporter [Ignavibacteria bacterium]|nr:cation diffusion facilitator family transporter [Ignavibacteria bacterium]